MKLEVGFVNGNQTSLIVDDFEFDEYDNVIRLKIEDKICGVIDANKISFWFCDGDNNEIRN